MTDTVTAISLGHLFHGTPELKPPEMSHPFAGRMVAHAVKSRGPPLSRLVCICLSCSAPILHLSHPVKYYSITFKGRTTEDVACVHVFPQGREHGETQPPSTGQRARGGCKTGGHEAARQQSVWDAGERSELSQKQPGLGKIHTFYKARQPKK